MEKVKDIITKNKVILASGSPRRLDLLRAIGIEPEVVKPDCSEDILTDLSPSQLVMALSLRKNICAREMLSENGNGEDYAVISSDTIVYYDGEVLGKPADEQDAFRMLSSLRGNMHSVYSGVCVWYSKDGIARVFYDRTDVYFKDYSDKDIWDYIESGKAMDKAGAYGIQAGFGIHVDRTEGEEDTVIGLPVAKMLSL